MFILKLVESNEDNQIQNGFALWDPKELWDIQEGHLTASRQGVFKSY